MGKKKKIILIIILVILGILLAFFLLVGRRKEDPRKENGAATTTAPATQAPIATPQRPRTQAEIQEMNQETQVLAIARTFAERYGSFSNQGGFLNLRDLEAISTDSLKGELQTFYAEQQKQSKEEYFGVTTRVVSLKVIEIDSDSASAEANTQRQESRGTPGNGRLYYQALKLQLIKSGNTWKVDSADWQ